MKIYDGSQFDDNPQLVADGILRKKLIYMVECFPIGEPKDRVYHDHVVELGRSYQGVWDIVIDIEKLAGVPETDVWNLSDPENRGKGVALWIEFINAFREGYGKEGRLAIYGGHANWVDYYQFILNGHGAQAICKKHDYFFTWEYELKPLMDVLDYAAPSVYGQYEKFSLENVANPRNYTYEGYRWMQEQCWVQTKSMIETLHNKPVEWFVTDNKRGILYPSGNIDWQLGRMGELVGDPIIMWNGKKYTDGWVPETVAAMTKHNA